MGNNSHCGWSSPSDHPIPTRQLFQVRNAKLDFPRFNGTNVLYWIFQAEQYFGYYEIPDAQRLVIASMHKDKTVMPLF